MSTSGNTTTNTPKPYPSSNSSMTQRSTSHSSSPNPHLTEYDHDGVVVKGVPENQKSHNPLDEATKTNNHRTGAEAVAGAGVGGGAVGEGARGGAGGAGAQGAGAQGAGSGGAGGKPKLDKYAYTFWSPEMAFFRKIVFKILGGGCMVLIIIMWLALPLYWGSLWLSNVYTYRLPIRIVDYDGGEIGQAVTQALMARTYQLGYFVSPASDYPNPQTVIDSMLDEQEWAAITINPGATATLTIARQNGLASYNGSNAISAYWAQARNELAMNSYVIPYIQQALGEVGGMLSARTAGEYLQANAGNQTAMTLLAQAPSTISNSVFYTIYNLRPYNQPVSNAITLVGLIYMLIFAFIVTMIGNGAREVIAPYLTTSSYIQYRLFVPLIIYLPIALLFAMVNLPFHVHFGAHYTYAGGFFLWAFTTYLGMCAMGLATEFAITIVGPKFIGFFLVAWIIVNVSTVALPHELQPWIYRYGVALPFWNLNRTVRTIIFDTKNEIAQNLGIILAWIVVSLITVSLATWLTRRGAVNQHRRAKREGVEAEK